MEIRKIGSKPYELEEGRQDGRLVQITIRAVGNDSELDLDTVRAATQELVGLLRQRPIRAGIGDRAARNSAAIAADRGYGNPEVVKAIDDMVMAYRRDGAADDAYLASLAFAYEKLVPYGRAVSTQLAKSLGLSPVTLKGHLVKAREDGWLSPAVTPGREGGQATEQARALLESMDAPPSPLK
ncbi:hypothetical protein [Mycobacteroides abscessus]|uniref:hypothetical protein n=1 Tax=Mycobacteroides abscessus TaxID=36809 RepID=UPI00089DD05C|nr:hypothetical protein [Mycobacteroides abscessus]ORA27999.1 hypothetical protein BST18_11710 [Mycobacteroides abscessus subsp. bolletii]TPF65886.1 hypothetical protein XW60_23085 [Mycobacteroides abscessus subsp. bolletii]BBB42644.1 hypothetical protein MASB_32100 [Mycobacteroides abscessus subsp. bolletii BD]